MKISLRDIRAGSGADIFLKNLSDGLAARGVKSSITLYPSYYQFAPSLLKLKKMRSDEQSLVHSNLYYGYVFKGHGPLIVTEHHVVHDPSMDRFRSSAQKIYHRLIYRREEKSLRAADAVTCHCEYTKRMLGDIFEYSDARVIYDGIDAEIFRPMARRKEDNDIAPGKTLLLFVGNMSKRKGADLLPHIMRKLGDDYHLLTTSGLRNDIRYNIKNVTVLGRVSERELVELYNLCDMLLFPTRLEGFGLTVAEAMACGKPVVTTACSSLPELVVDGKGGFLCCMDDVGDFAEKVELIAGDENLRRSMGEHNRKMVLEKFTLDRMARDYIRLYRSVM